MKSTMSPAELVAHQDYFPHRLHLLAPEELYDIVPVLRHAMREQGPVGHTYDRLVNRLLAATTLLTENPSQYRNLSAAWSQREEA